MRWIEATLFDGESIRDTNAHNSYSTEARELMNKTVIIHNDLNKSVSLLMQGSRDDLSWMDVGTAFEIGANTRAFQTCSAYFPFGRIIAQCSEAPTAGTLSIWCEKVG
jgi:hypothetical protein